MSKIVEYFREIVDEQFEHAEKYPNTLREIVALIDSGEIAKARNIALTKSVALDRMSIARDQKRVREEFRKGAK